MPRRLKLTLVLIGLALLIGIGGLILIRSRPRPAAAPTPVTNTAGAVSLGGFFLPETHRGRTAPRGTQVCDGIAFVCQGAIRTAGWNAARDGNRYAGAVLGVPVNRGGGRIHLL